MAKKDRNGGGTPTPDDDPDRTIRYPEIERAMDSGDWPKSDPDRGES